MKVLLILASLLCLVSLTSAGRVRGRCPPVAQIENGRKKGLRRLGESVRFTCRRGFCLQGVTVQNITCQSSKGRPAWSSDTRPTCVRIGECCHRRCYEIELLQIKNVLHKQLCSSQQCPFAKWYFKPYIYMCICKYMYTICIFVRVCMCVCEYVSVRAYIRVTNFKRLESEPFLLISMFKCFIS